MPDLVPSWILKDFLEQLDAWIDTEKPTQDLINHVTAWIMSRADDPYQGEFGVTTGDQVICP